ncbi:glycosyltransferase family 2 protein [Anthocerotibacter panamensis]|uniref:glycosyltransferase family 2 protein n=1 Tax=Anthocerotibacter panamensis TaxID=2857077 RepID=UPI001C404CF8|nr:glycosyltransferase [Anthocerotibacter panamensis]
MAAGLPTVAIFGALNLQLESPGPVSEDETRALDCRCYATDTDLEQILVHDQPDVLVTFGVVADFPNLLTAPFSVRCRWLHFERVEHLEAVGEQVFYCYLNGCLTKRTDAPPLVTVFTPTYRTGTRIERPLRSLLTQNYPEWEWVILDDSDDGGVTFSMLTDLAEQDHRIRVYRMHRHSGVIGQVKHQACMLGQGAILLELDHDDALTHDALRAVVSAFQQFPEAGFAYTHWAEVYEDGRNAYYGDRWGYGYGRHHEETYNGRVYIVQEAPRINPKTIRHIVSAPNHIRAWRRDFYLSVGGHNQNIHVADDYELCVRTFLNTRMILIPKLCYIQYYNSSGNTQRVRNQEIQRLTRYFQQWYDRAIHERFCALGVEDFVWNERGYTDWNIPNPTVEPHCSLIAQL